MIILIHTDMKQAFVFFFIITLMTITLLGCVDQDKSELVTVSLNTLGFKPGELREGIIKQTEEFDDSEMSQNISSTKSVTIIENYFVTYGSNETLNESIITLEMIKCKSINDAKLLFNYRHDQFNSSDYQIFSEEINADQSVMGKSEPQHHIIFRKSNILTILNAELPQEDAIDYVKIIITHIESI